MDQARKQRFRSHIFFFSGLYFLTRPAEYIRSSCWGHMGCDYFERIFSPQPLLGALLAIIGVIGIYKTTHCSTTSKWAVIFLLLILFSGWYYIYRPSIVFGDAKGNPICGDCHINDDISKPLINRDKL